MKKQDISINTIKNKYKKIYNYFFKYFIYTIILVLWIIKLINIFSNKDIVLENNKDFMIEKVKLIWEFNKKINSQTDNENIKTHILNWNFENDKDLLISNDNLISYKGIVLPKHTFIYQTKSLKDIKYFEDTGYDTNELVNIAKNTIFVNLDQIEKEQNQNTSLPLKENIENTFYIKCIKQKKLFDKICNNYTKNFLNNFYIYNIDQDLDWLIETFDILYNSKHKTAFCEGMVKYIIYSKNTDNRLEQIFIKCWKNYIQEYQTFKNFLDIHTQLEKWYITPNVYNEQILNEYKLISFQQIIYNDLQQNIINNIRINSYFDYLNNILKNTENIRWFYTDLTYRFNNHYLLDILNKNKYKFTENKRFEIENIIKNLNLINNWNILEWHKWLKILISNKELEKTQVEEIIEPETQSKRDTLIKNLKSLSFLKIINEKLSDEKLKISWYFLINMKEYYLPIYLWFAVNNDGILENINIHDYADLNETAENIITQNNYSIPDIYQYIQDNINLFASNENISTCDLIKSKLENYTETNKQINQLDITYCDKDTINIFKEEKEGEDIHKLFYKIILNNFNINKIQISNIELEKEINEYIKDIETNNITIATIIQKIVSYKPEKVNLKQEWSNNIIIAIEDFQNYLQIIPRDIFEIDGEIIVEFNLKNIDFIGTYDLKNKTLYKLSFKYQENANGITQEDLLINNFNLSLTDTNKNEINKFTLNPTNYIKNIDNNSLENYQKLQ